MVTVGNRIRKDVKPVKRGTLPGGNRRNVPAVRFRNHLGRHRRIGAGGYPDSGMGRKECAALPNRLPMGIDLPDIAESGPAPGEQIVGDPQLQSAYNRKAVLLHQVIDLVDRSIGAVLDRQHAIAAFSRPDRPKHVLKPRTVNDLGILEQAVDRNLGISPLHPLAGDHRIGGEQLGGVFQSRADLSGQRLLTGNRAVLIGASHLHQLLEQVGNIGRESGRSFLPRPAQDFPLPRGIKGRKVMLLLIGGHIEGNFHPLEEKPFHLAVDLVDPSAAVL